MDEQEQPKYWGSWKGRVISTIAADGKQTFSELQEKTGLAGSSLRKVIAELHRVGGIEKTQAGEYKVSRELYDQYRQFLHKHDVLIDTAEKKESPLTRFGATRKNNTIDWIRQWKDLKKLDFSLDPKHFFLEGMDLDDLSKSLIRRATLEVLAVNPYVDHCDLSNTLRDASRNVRAILVTHPPEEKNQFPKDRLEYHRILKEEGVKLIYNKKVHAKLLVIDRAVAIVSSMNFYAGSSGGVSWEAGLVSIEDSVVENVANSILRLAEKPESVGLVSTTEE